ncbi:histidine phosphatase family protein [Desulfobaculum sp. SPO524]|uniref:histidine phosphatase family protein n=1 Tax=Desulfobaculum sp. SPO524 TaxID=3378071 RepID=UPI0038528FAB
MLILCRHGEAQNARGRAIGQTNLPLSETGRRQALWLAQHVPQGSIATLAASPLQRTQHTAQPVAEACGLPITTIPELAEINLGTWDGLAFDDIRTRFPADYAARGHNIAGFRPPQGESFEDLAARCLPTITSLAEAKEITFAVTHAGVIRVALCMASSLPLEHLFTFRPKHTHCHLLTSTQSPFALTLTATNLPPTALAEAVAATT